MSSKTKKMKKTKKIQKNKKKKKEEESLREIKVRIVGVGGGGGSIISGISTNLKKVYFAAVNTDSRALEEATKNKKVKGVVFGKKITDGLGTGMDPKLGKQAAQEDIEEVKELFKDQDIVIFVSSLGGGTGSGAIPVFSSVAREMGCVVYGIFTLPFSFEGDKKMKIAKEAIKDSTDNLHAITILPNEKIFEIVDKNTSLKDALFVMNDNLARNIEGLAETIYETGLINIDFADVKTVLENRKGMRKLTYLSSAQGNLEEGVEEIVKKAISNPLYPYKVNNARGVLFNITGGKDIGLTDISSISESIAKHTQDDAKIIVGIMQKQKYKENVKVSILATGCETDFFQKELEGEIVEEKKNADNVSKIKKTKNKKNKKEKQENQLVKKENLKKQEKEIEKEKPKEEIKKEKGVTVVPASNEKKYNDSFSERTSSPESEEEKEILKEEEKWERPSFLRKFKP